MTEERIRKKKTGEFYTPRKIAELMAAELLKDFDPKEGYPKVLDPSCGDGELLLAVFYRLLQLYGGIMSQEMLKKKIVEEMLFGMDIDVSGLERTRWRLFEASGVWSENFKLGDFLLEEGHKDAFSHVIGNPPYIGHKGLSLDHKKKLKEAYPEVYVNKTDILSCFFPGAMKYLVPGGRLVFITSRYYLEAPTYVGLRGFLVREGRLERIIDFDFLHVFKEARIASCITVLRKEKIEDRKEEKDKKEASFFYDRYMGAEKKKELEDVPVSDSSEGTEELTRFGLFKRYMGPQSGLEEKGWCFPSVEEREVKGKIEFKSNYSLKDIFHSYQGIITGCDPAFVIKEEKELEGWTEKEKSLLRPWIKNSFIGKYHIEDRGYQLIYSNAIGDLTEYPHIHQRLLEHKERLEKRREVLKGFRRWYDLQWGREEQLFRKKKIVHPYKAHGNRFSVDSKGMFCSADVYFMIPKKTFESYLEYITALLNSNLYDRYFKSFGKRMGGKIFDYYPNKVMEMKIYLPKSEEEQMEMKEITIAYEAICKMESHEVDEIKNLETELERRIEKLYAKT